MMIMYEKIKVLKTKNKINWNFVLGISKALKNTNNNNFCIYLYTKPHVDVEQYECNELNNNNNSNDSDSNDDNDSDNSYDNINADINRDKQIYSIPSYFFEKIQIFDAYGHVDDWSLDYNKLDKQEISAFYENKSTPVCIINLYPYLNNKHTYVDVYIKNINFFISSFNTYLYTLFLQKSMNKLVLNDINTTTVINGPIDFNYFNSKRHYHPYKHHKHLPKNYNIYEDYSNDIINDYQFYNND